MSEENSQQQTYTIKVYCSNCKWEGYKKINKGLSVESIEKDECPVCGNRYTLKSLGIEKTLDSLNNKTY